MVGLLVHFFYFWPNGRPEPQETTVTEMTHNPLLERLTGVVGPALAPLGVSLWGLEFASAGSRMVLRVYIDTETGVDVGACARVSRALGAVLDAEDVMPGPYVLEVSSPGLERRFFSAGQMAAYQGQEVDIRLHEPQDGRRHFRGQLSGVEGDDVHVTEGDKSFRVPFGRIKAAHLVHQFPEPGVKGA